MHKVQLRISVPALNVLPRTVDVPNYAAPRAHDAFKFGGEATEIVPRVYIADLATAQSRSALLALGITHVVSAVRGRAELPADLLPRLSTYQVPVEDMPFAELLPEFDGCVAFIARALSNPSSRVLVHCAKGVSRSASVVAAFLVATRGFSAEAAIHAVQARRGIARPNPGFVVQLEEYAAQLRAQGR